MITLMNDSYENVASSKSAKWLNKETECSKFRIYHDWASKDTYKMLYTLYNYAREWQGEADDWNDMCEVIELIYGKIMNPICPVNTDLLAENHSIEMEMTINTSNYLLHMVKYSKLK